MLLSSRTALMLLDAAEEEGVPRTSLVTRAGIASPAARPMTWDVLVHLVDELARIVDGDTRRLHRIGRRMLATPGTQPGKRLGVASVRGLYELSQEWFARLDFPHLRYFVRFDRAGITLEPTRVSIHLAIPEPHAPSTSFLRLVEGALVAMPNRVGLRLATVVESKVTATRTRRRTSIPSSSPPSRSRRARSSARRGSSVTSRWCRRSPRTRRRWARWS